MIRTIAFAFASSLALVACADADPVVEDNDAIETDFENPDVAVIPTLEPVNADEVTIDFEPRLGVCNFETDGETLLVAGTTGDEGTSGLGVVRMNGQDLRLQAGELGGPDALSAGPMLFGGEYTVQIDRAETGTDAEMESLSYPATLTLRKEGMSEVVYGPGRWTCSV